MRHDRKINTLTNISFAQPIYTHRTHHKNPPFFFHRLVCGRVNVCECIFLHSSFSSINNMTDGMFKIKRVDRGAYTQCQQFIKLARVAVRFAFTTGVSCSLASSRLAVHRVYSRRMRAYDEKL